MVLGIGKLKRGIKKMFRSSEDLHAIEPNLPNSGGNEVKRRSKASEKSRRRSLVLDSRFLSSSAFHGSSNIRSNDLSTNLSVLSLAETTATISTSIHDLREGTGNIDNGDISVSGTLFRAKCLEESLIVAQDEEEKENVTSLPQQRSPITSPKVLGMQKQNSQPTMGIQAKQFRRGDGDFPQKSPLSRDHHVQRSLDYADELKAERLRKSQSLSHLKYLSEMEDNPNDLYHLQELDILGLEGSGLGREDDPYSYPPPPVPKPRLSLLNLSPDADIRDVAQIWATSSPSVEERKEPVIFPRTSKRTVFPNQAKEIKTEENQEGHEDLHSFSISSSSSSLLESGSSPLTHEGRPMRDRKSEQMKQQMMYCLPYQS